MDLFEKDQYKGRFFHRISANGKISSQPMGKNTMGDVAKEVVKVAGVSDVSGFTRHCFRRSCASTLPKRRFDASWGMKVQHRCRRLCRPGQKL